MCWSSFFISSPLFIYFLYVALCRYTYHAGRDVVVLLFSFSFYILFSFPPFNFLILPWLRWGASVYVQSAQYSIHCILGRLAFTRFVRFSLDEFHKAINKVSRDGQNEQLN